jgi:hypothetical protein
VRVSVTREEHVERTWVCERCGAGGHVVLHAIGDSGWKEVWFSRDEAEDAAHEDARWAVQRDAERMLGMVRCPSCRMRARGVHAWAVLRNIIPVGVGLGIGAALAVVILVLAHWPFWLAPFFMLAGAAVALLPERRRWIEANNTTVRDLVPGDPEKVALVRAKKTAAAMPRATARALPPAKPAALAPVASRAPEPIERPADDEGPRFLRDK